MSINSTTYNAVESPLHRLDARVKIVLSIAFAAVLFFVESWPGLGMCALAFTAAALVGRMQPLVALGQLKPVVFIAVATVLFNSFALDVSQWKPLQLNLALSADISTTFFGTFGFIPAGFEQGCFLAGRIILLVLASLVLTTTTTSTAIAQALESMLSPLGRIGVPTRDIAAVASVALRFIPVTVDEFQTLKAAQVSRGAAFDTGSLIARMRTWQTVLIPLFVGLYRRADRLASSMDARCYGVGKPTRMNSLSLDVKSIVVCVAGLALLVLIAIAA